MQPVFIAGPCVIESAELLETVAQELVKIKKSLPQQYKNAWVCN